MSSEQDFPTMHTITFRGLQRGSVETAGRVQWRYGDWIASRVSRLWPEANVWTVTDFVITSMESVFPKLTKKEFVTEDKKALMALMNILIDHAAKKALRQSRPMITARQQKVREDVVEKVCKAMSASDQLKRKLLKLIGE